MKPIELNTFQGHIVLLCKNHYKCDNIFDGLKKIWAIRCGYDYKLTSYDTYSYIAKDMWDIISKCCPDKIHTYINVIHRELTNQAFYKPEAMTPIEAVIWEYRSILSTMQVKDKVDDKWVWLVKLPKPMKRVFNRILRGNGRYKDYYLIEPKK